MLETPRGLKTLLYDEAQIKERIERTALDTFAGWGYSRTFVPSMEFYNSFTKGLLDEDKKRVITLPDPAGSEKQIALRSDVTPQIARIAATMLSRREKPLRLSYSETVYRRAKPGLGQRMERAQAGAELIGVSSPKGDAETIAMAAQALIAMGVDITNIKIAIGHIGYVDRAIEAMGLADETARKVRKALLKKDQHTLTETLNSAKAGGAGRKALENFHEMFGGVEVLGKADKNIAGSVIDEISEVTDILGEYKLKDQVSIDLCEVRGFGYYTGITFEGFIMGMNKRAFQGGRYDDLLALYGSASPATGVAIDIDNLVGYFSQ